MMTLAAQSYQEGHMRPASRVYETAHKKSEQVSKQVSATFWPYIRIRGSNTKVKINNPLPVSKKVKEYK